MSDLFQILYGCLKTKNIEQLNETLWTYESKCADYNIVRGGLIGKGRNGEVYLVQDTDSYLIRQLPYAVVIKKTNWSVLNDAARQQQHQHPIRKSIFGRKRNENNNVPYSVVKWQQQQQQHDNNTSGPILVVSSSYILEILISAVWNHFYDSGVSPHFLYTAHAWLEPNAIFLVTEMCGTVQPSGSPLNKALLRSVKRALQDKYDIVPAHGKQQQQQQQQKQQKGNALADKDVSMQDKVQEKESHDSSIIANEAHVSNELKVQMRQEYDAIVSQCVPFASSMLDLPLLLPFMKLDMSALEKIVLEEHILVLLLQIVLMQEHYQMVHHDLKLDNVYFRFIQRNDRFRNEDLSAIQYFCYRLVDARDSSENRFYIPNRGYLLKIGDAGMCTLHRFPTIIATSGGVATDKQSGFQLMSQRFFEDQKGEVKEKFGILPQFQRGYDVQFLLPQLQMFCDKHSIKPRIVQQIKRYMTVAVNKQMRPDTTRPLLMRPEDVINELSWNNTLTRIPPPSAKVLEMKIVHHLNPINSEPDR